MAKMTKARMAMIRDLSNHYRNKIDKISEDIQDTADRMEIEETETYALIVRNLIGYSAYICIITEGDKESFLRICSDIFDEMKNGKVRARMQ